MILFKRSSDISDYIKKEKSKGKKIGFAPTMGALHRGHISLVETSLRENEITLSSIFINPTQFNDPKDFEKYPVTLEKDIYLLENAGCDVLFLPDISEIYPHGTTANQSYELGYLETILEGKFRPGHFQGVCQVVHRLLDIVVPHRLYIGQKDYQQCMVIRKLIDLIDNSAKISICPTMREENGLAMSSRNLRLSPGNREKAGKIFTTLSAIRDKLKPGPLAEMELEARHVLVESGFKVDYVEIASAENLEMPENWDGNSRMVALAAASLDNVRLIDNLLLN
jgi:pantoate--beta-alanine ligase